MGIIIPKSSCWAEELAIQTLDPHLKGQDTTQLLRDVAHSYEALREEVEREVKQRTIEHMLMRSYRALMADLRTEPEVLKMIKQEWEREPYILYEKSKIEVNFMQCTNCGYIFMPDENVYLWHVNIQEHPTSGKYHKIFEYFPVMADQAWEEGMHDCRCRECVEEICYE